MGYITVGHGDTPHRFGAELSGLVNVINAAAYDNLVLTAGIRAVVSFMDLGLGFKFRWPSERAQTLLL